MADNNRNDSNEEGEASGNPTPHPSVAAAPTPISQHIPQPGRLEFRSDNGSGTDTIMHAPRKPTRLEKCSIPSSLEHSKTLFKDTEGEPVDSSILTVGAHTLPGSTAQSVTIADMSSITGITNRDWAEPATDNGSGTTELSFDSREKEKVGVNSERRSTKSHKHFMNLPPDAVVNDTTVNYTDGQGVSRRCTDSIVQPSQQIDALNTVREMRNAATDRLSSSNDESRPKVLKTKRERDNSRLSNRSSIQRDSAPEKDRDDNKLKSVEEIHAPNRAYLTEEEVMRGQERGPGYYAESKPKGDNQDWSTNANPNVSTEGNVAGPIIVYRANPEYKTGSPARASSERGSDTEHCQKRYYDTDNSNRRTTRQGKDAYARDSDRSGHAHTHNTRSKSTACYESDARGTRGIDYGARRPLSPQGKPRETARYESDAYSSREDRTRGTRGQVSKPRETARYESDAYSSREDGTRSMRKYEDDAQISGVHSTRETMRLSGRGDIKYPHGGMEKPMATRSRENGRTSNPRRENSPTVGTPHSTYTQRGDTKSVVFGGNSTLAPTTTGGNRRRSALAPLRRLLGKIEDDSPIPTYDARNPRIKIAPVVPFKGEEGEDAVGFLANVFADFTIQRVEPDMAPTVFGTYLRERASVWFKSLARETKEDWEQIVPEFERVFITAGKKRRLQSWMGLKQEPGEKMATFIYRFEKLQVEALDNSDYSLTQKFICSLGERYTNQLAYNEPSSFSEAKEQARRAEVLFATQDKNTLELLGETPGGGKIRAIDEAQTIDLGATYSGDKGDPKQILIEVQERIAKTEKTLAKYDETMNDQTKTMSQFSSTLNDLGFKIKNLANERNDNANGRGKPIYRGSNNNNRGNGRRNQRNPYNPDVSCVRCESTGHIEQECFRRACSCKKWHTRMNPESATCVLGEYGMGHWTNKPDRAQGTVRVLNAIFETPRPQVLEFEDQSYLEPQDIEDIEGIHRLNPNGRHVVNRVMDCIETTPMLPGYKEVSVGMKLIDNSCYLSGTVDGVETTFLVDTGASMSLISKKFLDILPGKHTISHTGSTCSTADGTSIKLLGVCALRMSIKGFCLDLSLHVTEDPLTNYGILGIDNLRHYGATMRLGSPMVLTLNIKGAGSAKRLSSSAGKTCTIDLSTVTNPAVITPENGTETPTERNKTGDEDRNHPSLTSTEEAQEISDDTQRETDFMAYVQVLKDWDNRPAEEFLSELKSTFTKLHVDMDSHVAMKMFPSCLWPQASRWFSLLPYKVRNSLPLAITALLDEFGSSRVQLNKIVNREGEHVPEFGRMYFPIVPSLKFIGQKFLMQPPEETKAPVIPSEAVYEPEHALESRSEENPGSWINLRAKGMQAWLRSPRDSDINSGDQVMVKSGRNPRIFGEEWAKEWSGPYTVGHTIDPRIMTLECIDTRNHLKTGVPYIRLRKHIRNTSQVKEGNLAALFTAKGVCRVLNKGFMKGRPHCLEEFTLPVAPKISKEDRSTIIMEQILQPNPDRIELSEWETEQLTSICTRYPDLWSIHPMEVRPANNTPATIKLQEGTKMKSQRPYDLSYYETIHLARHLNMLLASDIIERSSSAYNSPVLMVLKGNPIQYLSKEELPETASISLSMSSVKELVLKKTAGDMSKVTDEWKDATRNKRLFQKGTDPEGKRKCRCDGEQKCQCFQDNSETGDAAVCGTDQPTESDS